MRKNGWVHYYVDNQFLKSFPVDDIQEFLKTTTSTTIGLIYNGSATKFTVLRIERPSADVVSVHLCQSIVLNDPSNNYAWEFI